MKKIALNIKRIFLATFAHLQMSLNALSSTFSFLCVWLFYWLVAPLLALAMGCLKSDAYCLTDLTKKRLFIC